MTGCTESHFPMICQFPDEERSSVGPSQEESSNASNESVPLFVDIVLLRGDRSLFNSNGHGTEQIANNNPRSMAECQESLFW